MEIRMAYPNEIKQIMEIIQDAKESLAQRQVDQWQDGYPDEEIIFEDILESRGYVAVEDQEVVAYAAVYKGNEAAYNEIYDGKWEHDNYMYVTFHRVAVAKEEELDLEEVDLIQEIDTLVQEGMKKNQAIKQVSKQYGLQKSELYARYHQD